MFTMLVVLLACCATIASANPIDSADRLEPSANHTAKATATASAAKASTNLPDSSNDTERRADIREIHAIFRETLG